MKLQCECCGFEQEFGNPEEAFEAGWDCPPRFQYVACAICPGVCVVMGAGHEKAHALWAKEGRPSEFTLAKCATDADFGDEKKLAKAESDMKRVEAMMEAMIRGPKVH